MPLRASHRTLPDEPAAQPSRALWLVLAAVALLAIWLGWHFFFSSAATAPVRPAVPTTAPPSVVRPATAAASPVERARPAEPTPVAHAGAAGWYVVAFTYNHEDQAATKVQRLRRNHNSLHPEVFSPTGRAPYLVVLGGAMSQNEAEAVYRHARRSGLPHDTFVRRY